MSARVRGDSLASELSRYLAPRVGVGYAGAPSQSERIASTMIVNGLTSANARRTAGIDWTGTKAEEMKVSGKTAMKPTEFAASGEDDEHPEEREHPREGVAEQQQQPEARRAPRADARVEARSR